MADALTAGAVRQVAMPPDARSLSTLPRVDYEDAFLVPLEAADDRTAEQWARAILEDAPIAVRSALTSTWHTLGLRLGSPLSERHVLGWEVRRSDRDVVLLGARSRVGMPAELLVRLEPRTLLFATFVQFENPLARTVWAGVEPMHVRVVPRMLERGRAAA
ncbi:MAG: hypothetical protein QOI80_2489 [Solirubrobacteraceae bacterium]|jgi:hypothetical protein|nr:hypothetical protein [Solirubrobacteraceae bacterium]